MFKFLKNKKGSAFIQSIVTYVAVGLIGISTIGVLNKIVSNASNGELGLNNEGFVELLDKEEDEFIEYKGGSILLSGGSATLVDLNSPYDVELVSGEKENYSPYIVISRRGKVTYYPNGHSDKSSAVTLITEKEYASGTRTFKIPETFGYLNGKDTGGTIKVQTVDGQNLILR